MNSSNEGIDQKKTYVANFFIVYLAYNFIQLDGILIFSIKYMYDDNNALWTLRKFQFPFIFAHSPSFYCFKKTFTIPKRINLN